MPVLSIDHFRKSDIFAKTKVGWALDVSAVIASIVTSY